MVRASSFSRRKNGDRGKTTELPKNATARFSSQMGKVIAAMKAASTSRKRTLALCRENQDPRRLRRAGGAGIRPKVKEERHRRQREGTSRPCLVRVPVRVCVPVPGTRFRIPRRARPWPKSPGDGDGDAY